MLTVKVHLGNEVGVLTEAEWKGLCPADLRQPDATDMCACMCVCMHVCECVCVCVCVCMYVAELKIAPQAP
jgi:hypothetical protein